MVLCGLQGPQNYISVEKDIFFSLCILFWRWDDGNSSCSYLFQHKKTANGAPRCNNSKPKGAEYGNKVLFVMSCLILNYVYFFVYYQKSLNWLYAITLIGLNSGFKRVTVFVSVCVYDKYFTVAILCKLYRYIEIRNILVKLFTIVILYLFYFIVCPFSCYGAEWRN